MYITANKNIGSEEETKLGEDVHQSRACLSASESDNRDMPMSLGPLMPLDEIIRHIMDLVKSAASNSHPHRLLIIRASRDGSSSSKNTPAIYKIFRNSASNESGDLTRCINARSQTDYEDTRKRASIENARPTFPTSLPDPIGKYNGCRPSISRG